MKADSVLTVSFRDRIRNAIVVDPSADRRWDAFARNQAGASFYHLSAWSEVLARTYSFRPVYLATESAANRLDGILPLFFVTSRLTGTKLQSLPFSDVGGPLAEDDRAKRLLLTEAIHLQERSAARYLQIRTEDVHVPDLDSRLVPDRRYVDYVLLLDGDPDTVWARAGVAKARNRVRRAVRAGVTVRPGNGDADLYAFYRLHRQTTKRHGMPAQPFAYFKYFRDLLASDCDVRLLLAEHHERIVAGGLFVAFRGCLHYVYNASDQNALELSPSYPLVWDAIQWAYRCGCRRMSFGKTSVANAGLVKFKRQWGAQPEPLTYLYYPSVEGLTSSNYAENRRQHRILTAGWRALPSPITDLVGGLLYRHLA